MQHADDSHDSAEYERKNEPRTGRRSDSEVVVERTPIIADAPRGEGEMQSGPGMERRRAERRRSERMSTGI
jgi:hypothetical protein